MIHVNRGNVIVLSASGGRGRSSCLSWITRVLFLAILILQVYQVVRLDVRLENDSNSSNKNDKIMYQRQGISKELEHSDVVAVVTPRATFSHSAHTSTVSFLRTNTTRRTRRTAKESFSACLMFMDDNPHLIEWLAYHYHVLPLRRLIIAVDPRSQTSPSEILAKWGQNGKKMVITEWSDLDFMPPHLMDAHKSTTTMKTKTTTTIAAALDDDDKNNQEELTKLFRQRQEQFYARCMARLKYEQKTWVALIDTDEYITPNTHSLQHRAYIEQQQQSSKRSITVLDLLHAQEQHPVLPEMEAVEDGSTSPLAAAQQETRLAQQLQASPCFPMARLTFGVKESEESELYNNDAPIPWGFDPKNFQTLRWRWHAGRSKKSINKISKSLIDVSRVDSSLFVPTQQVMVHLPIQAHCHGQDDLWLLNANSLLVVHHYGGTWEQWSSRRGDPRGKRTREAYDKMKYDKQIDDTIRPWLSAFVTEVGWWTARRLLQGVGQIE